MDYREHIQRAIDYIEENLSDDLDLEACANAAGYSTYHFLRIFKETLKLTPVDYIRKRRLSEIAKKIVENDSFISDIAFFYGFNSKENFIRAFKAEHHILPTEYKSALNSLELYGRIELSSEPFSVTPEICYLESFFLTVYQCREEYPPKFWNIYNCKKLSKKLSGGVVCEDYGVSVWDGRLNYFIGIRKELAIGDCSDTILIEIPGGTYAVFTTPKANHYNFVDTVHRTWSYINTVWLCSGEYERRNTPEFEVYIEESRSFSERIYIPIKEKCT